MSNTERIAAILRRHKAPRGFCSCGEWVWTHRGEIPFERHVAEEIAALMSTPSEASLT